MHDAFRELAKDALAFGTGWSLQEGTDIAQAYASGGHAYLGETLDGFADYWSPLSSPANFTGLVGGVLLSLVPKKAGSKARWAARHIGKFMVAAEGWGYAEHNQAVGQSTGAQLLAAGPSNPPVAGVSHYYFQPKQQLKGSVDPFH